MLSLLWALCLCVCVQGIRVNDERDVGRLGKENRNREDELGVCYPVLRFISRNNVKLCGVKLGL